MSQIQTKYLVNQTKYLVIKFNMWLLKYNGAQNVSGNKFLKKSYNMNSCNLEMYVQ